MKKLWLETMGSQYEKKFPELLGYGIGLEQREVYLSISEDSNVQILSGMCFVITISISDIQVYSANGEQPQLMAIGLSDTVLVMDQANDNLVLTSSVDKSYKRISFQYSENENVLIDQNDKTTSFVRLRRDEFTSKEYSLG